MRRTFVILGGIGVLVAGVAGWWRRHPRVGAEWVNRVFDPWLVRQGLVDKSAGEIGLIEHLGRKSGTVRMSPVHPMATSDGFRIVVPLGLESRWAQNVLAAGHCRLQVGPVVHELDEPMLVAPSAIDGVPRLARLVMQWLGFRYLVLHRYAEAPGTLASVPTPAEARARGEPVPA